MGHCDRESGGKEKKTINGHCGYAVDKVFRTKSSWRHKKRETRDVREVTLKRRESERERGGEEEEEEREREDR